MRRRKRKRDAPRDTGPSDYGAMIERERVFMDIWNMKRRREAQPGIPTVRGVYVKRYKVSC